MKFALIALCGVAASAVPTPPTLPASFTAKMMMSMPYVQLTEPLTVHQSASKQLQVLSYWEGMDTYINSWGTDHDSYQIIPTTEDGENSAETCWTIPAPKEPAESPAVALYPDFSAFQFTGTHTVNGKECNAFSLDQPEYNSTTGNIGK